MSSRFAVLTHSADRRTVFWSLILFPALPLLAFWRPDWSAWLWPLALYTGFCSGVITHYHVHRPVFRARSLNRFYSLWLSVFYGFPIWSWIPTHNQNHHEHTNGPLDATSTFRRGRPDSLWEAISYPTRSSAWQAPALGRYLGELRRRHPERFVEAIVQALAVPLAHGALIWFFTSTHGLALGGLAYFVSLGLPALFAPWAMMFINYLQHVGCDPDSADDHSRNFVGAWENWLVFQAGLHTVHHENPTAHWSDYARLHAERAPFVASVLHQRNVFAFLFRRYVLGERRHILRTTLDEPAEMPSAA